jgi:hypothetical protein
MMLRTIAKAKQARRAVSFLSMVAALFSCCAGRRGFAQSAPDFPGKDWQLVSPESKDPRFVSW